jgi:hypothetical protein
MGNVKVIDRGMEQFKRELERMRAAIVTVGLHQDSGSNKGVHIAEYAAYNEYGTENVPSRPFMRTTFDENVQSISQVMKEEYLKTQDGRSTASRGLNIVGLKYAEMIKETIRSRNFLPRLKPATIKAKKGSTKTLVDSNEMVKAIKRKVKI